MKTVKDLRHELGLTQQELADLLGVAPLSVWKWEARRVEPTATHVRALARLCNVSMDDIDFGVAAEEPPPPETEDGG